MNKYLVEITNEAYIYDLLKFTDGIITLSAKHFKGTVILETKMSREEINKITYVVSAEDYIE